MLLLCLQHVVFNYSLYFAGRFGVYCLVMLFVEVDAKRNGAFLCPSKFPRTKRRKARTGWGCVVLKEVRYRYTGHVVLSNSASCALQKALALI